MAEILGRKEWLSLLAKAPRELVGKFAGYLDGDAPGFTWLRAPETGGVMVQGRAGGTGDAFNLGEMTVTRCSLRLESGEVGHGYVQGRSREKARLAALCDALMQTGRASEVRERVLEPVAAEMASVRARRKAKADATKVEFFTMVRGED